MDADTAGEGAVRMSLEIWDKVCLRYIMLEGHKRKNQLWGTARYFTVQDFGIWTSRHWRVFLGFLQLYCSTGISPMKTSGCFSWGKPALTESHHPIYGACWVLKCFHNPLNSDMDYGIFNVRIDVNVCNCTQGCLDTVREPALEESWLWEKNPLLHWGIEHASAACRFNALPTEPHSHSCWYCENLGWWGMTFNNDSMRNGIQFVYGRNTVGIFLSLCLRGDFIWGVQHEMVPL